MAKKIAQLIVDENTTIFVETTEEEIQQSAGGMGHAGVGDKIKTYVIQAAKEKFGDAMSIISFSSNTILGEIDKIQKKPEQAQIEFGVKITGEGKAMLASGGVEANYKITLSWKKTP